MTKASKREAVAALNIALGELDPTRPDTIGVAGATLRVYLMEWLDGQRPYLRASTLHSYRIAVGRILGRLGDTTLKSVTPSQVQVLQTDLLAAGGRDGRPLSAKTVANTHVVLHKALADAVRLGLLDRNVVAAVDPPRVPRPDLSVWSVDQVRVFLSVASSHRLSAAFVLLATTGMRRSEVLGLRWSDIDLDDRALSIIRTLTVVDGRPVVAAPKTTASRRLVYLDSGTVNALRAHHDRSTNSYDDYVFQSADGQPVNPASFSNTFDRLVTRSGLPRIRLHDLRHTYSTLALRLGTHPVLLSERLGHTSIEGHDRSLLARHPEHPQERRRRRRTTHPAQTRLSRRQSSRCVGRPAASWRSLLAGVSGSLNGGGRAPAFRSGRCVPASVRSGRRPLAACVAHLDPSRSEDSTLRLRASRVGTADA